MIRRITKNDKELYLNLAKEFYSSDAVLHSVPDECRENTFNEMMRCDDYLVGYIIEYDEKHAGYAMLAKTFSPEVGGLCIWIEEIYILEGFQGKGLGTEFFNFIFKEFNGTAKRFRLEAIKENQGAISLYEKLEFEGLDYMQMVRDED